MTGARARAIAAATNEPVMTVQNELARVRVRTPEPSPVTEPIVDRNTGEVLVDAEEMVRRAEYAVRKSVTAAQKAGEVRSREQNLKPFARSSPTCASEQPSAESFFASTSEYRDANAMAELTTEQFEDVLTEARAEGNLSRPHIVEKAREITRPEQPSRKPPRKAVRNRQNGPPPHRGGPFAVLTPRWAQPCLPPRSDARPVPVRSRRRVALGRPR